MDFVSFPFALFGVLFLTHELVKAIKFAFVRFVKKGTSPAVYGTWAVVTGATDGIGKELSILLAQRGMNLILISRTTSKLEEVKKEIQAKNASVQVDLVQVDYSDFEIGSANYKKVALALEKRKQDLGLLVNNVGVSYNFPRYFHELPEEEIAALIKLNINSTTYMTKLFLPFLLEKPKGKSPRGCIVNIGSFAGVFASPLLAEYSAAKSYVERFSESLSFEYAKEKIEVQCHVPLYIESKMSKMRKGLMVPTAKQYGQMVLDFLGKDVVVSGHFLQSFATEVAKLLPRRLFMIQVRKMHEGIRVKGFRKMERSKAN